MGRATDLLREVRWIVARYPGELGFDASAEVAEAAVGTTTAVAKKTHRHWRPRKIALDFAPGESVSVTRRKWLPYTPGMP